MLSPIFIITFSQKQNPKSRKILSHSPKMKHKKSRRGSRLFRLLKRRKSNHHTDKSLKLSQCQKIIEQKTCEVCGGKQEDQNMVLCDRCDDAYHWPCLGMSQSPFMKEIWLCPGCVKLKGKVKDTPKSVPTVCSKCGKMAHQVQKLAYTCQDTVREIVLGQSELIQCLYCGNHFHEKCFSTRNNSLNCWQCQIKIRRQGPRSHQQFFNFLKTQLILVHHRGFLQLQSTSQTKQTKKRATQMGLKVFDQLTNWQLITRYEASLYYALKTRDLIFSDEQIYASKQLMELNDSQKEIVEVRPLHRYDEKVYEVYKAKIRRGAVGPFQLKEDRILGFYVTALMTIEKGTIISEFTGEVLNLRESLTEQKNDSIFTLLITGSSKGDLNIAPKAFGNMSRFICGINDKQKQHLKRVNVMSVRFSYRNRMRILLFAQRKIEKGEILYMNYNAGTYEEYPTSNFI